MLRGVLITGHPFFFISSFSLVCDVVRASMGGVGSGVVYTRWVGDR